MSRWILAGHCQGQNVCITESLGLQVPGVGVVRGPLFCMTMKCDVKKTSIPWQILAGNWQYQGVYSTEGLGGQLPGCRDGPWTPILCDHELTS